MNNLLVLLVLVLVFGTGIPYWYYRYMCVLRTHTGDTSRYGVADIGASTSVDTSRF